MRDISQKVKVNIFVFVHCFVRYSNTSFSGSAGYWEIVPQYLVYNTADINSYLTEFKMIWEDLIGRMITAASAARSTPSSSNNYYKVDVANLTKFQNIYALMQCTPDITPGDCNNCLRESVIDYQSCCAQNTGGYVMRPICFFRWELLGFSKAFANITLAPPPPSSPPPLRRQPPSAGDQATARKNNSRKLSVGAIVGIVVMVLLLLTIILGLLARKSVVLCWKTKPSQEVDLDQSGITTVHSLQFDFKTIEVATDKFTRSNKLGQGGFGEVLEGTLPNGIEVAVKRLSKTSAQGAQEFKNEVVLVAKLQHRNLVRLLGFCLEGE